jgi:hypothetical protein
MSAAPTTPTAQPTPAAADQPNRFAPLLSIVRKLIDYGRQLAASLQQRTLTNDLASVTLGFGTKDIALILARITRGLHRAAALEASLESGTARLGVTFRPVAAPARRQPRAAQPAAPRGGDGDARLDRLPTPAQIAADVRRRPAGAVIADICRDLGILPNHPLWRELRELIICHDGNLAILYRDINRRLFPLAEAARLAFRRGARPAPRPPSPGPAGTGPP